MFQPADRSRCSCPSLLYCRPDGLKIAFNESAILPWNMVLVQQVFLGRTEVGFDVSIVDSGLFLPGGLRNLFVVLRFRLWLVCFDGLDRLGLGLYIKFLLFLQLRWKVCPSPPWVVRTA